MKKLIIAAAMLFGFAGMASAQKATAAAPAQKSTTANATAKPTISTAQTVHTKADGTPDMRYKENKAKAAPVVHKKADGTPDKRFKENKTAKTAKAAKS